MSLFLLPLLPGYEKCSLANHKRLSVSLKLPTVIKTFEIELLNSSQTSQSDIRDKFLCQGSKEINLALIYMSPSGIKVFNRKYITHICIYLKIYLFMIIWGHNKHLGNVDSENRKTPLGINRKIKSDGRM